MSDSAEMRKWNVLNKASEKFSVFKAHGFDLATVPVRLVFKGYCFAIIRYDSAIRNSQAGNVA